MAKKSCRKFQSAELQTDDRQTDGMAIAYSELEHKFTFARKHAWGSWGH